jgi:hypothetical protein
MQSPRQSSIASGNSDRDRIERPPDTTGPAGDSQSGGQPDRPGVGLRAYARTHRKTLAAAAAATLAAGYAATRAMRVLRARRRVQQALDAYADAEAELEATEARGWLGFGRKKTPLERAEENF